MTECRSTTYHIRTWALTMQNLNDRTKFAALAEPGRKSRKANHRIRFQRRTNKMEAFPKTMIRLESDASQWRLLNLPRGMDRSNLHSIKFKHRPIMQPNWVNDLQFLTYLLQGSNTFTDQRTRKLFVPTGVSLSNLAVDGVVCQNISDKLYTLFRLALWSVELFETCNLIKILLWALRRNGNTQYEHMVLIVAAHERVSLPAVLQFCGDLRSFRAQWHKENSSTFCANHQHPVTFQILGVLTEMASFDKKQGCDFVEVFDDRGTGHRLTCRKQTNSFFFKQQRSQQPIQKWEWCCGNALCYSENKGPGSEPGPSTFDFWSRQWHFFRSCEFL